MPLPYVFDPLGNNPANRVTDETHVLTGVNYRDFAFILPLYAPFFADESLQLTLVTGMDEQPLVRDQDYFPVLEFLGASIMLGRPVYGGICFAPLYTSGTIRLDQYQTLGGEWLDDTTALHAMILNRAINPRAVSWDQITNRQQVFPPTDHAQPADTVTFDALLEAIQNLTLAIATLPPVTLTVRPPQPTSAEILAAEGLDKYPSFGQIIDYLVHKGVISSP